MPVKAIPKISRSQNGVRSNINACFKITLQYCNWGGSSAGARALLTSGAFNNLATNKASTYFEIVKNQGHPTLTFHFNNNTSKVVEIKNVSPEGIMQKLDEYSQRSGRDLAKFNQRVISNNESIRGIWSPLHVHRDVRHRI